MPRPAAPADSQGDLDAKVLAFVARKVRGQLAEHERTQHDAATVLDLSQAAVSRRLKGEVDFGVTELVRLAAWLEVPVGDLLPRLDSNQQPAGNRAAA